MLLRSLCVCVFFFFVYLVAYTDSLIAYSDSWYKCDFERHMGDMEETVAETDPKAGAADYHLYKDDRQEAKAFRPWIFVSCISNTDRTPQQMSWNETRAS